MSDQLTMLLRNATETVLGPATMPPAGVALRAGRRRRRHRVGASVATAASVSVLAFAFVVPAIHDEEQSSLSTQADGGGPYVVHLVPAYDGPTHTTKPAEDACIANAPDAAAPTTTSGGQTAFTFSSKPAAVQLFDCLWDAVGPQRVLLGTEGGPTPPGNPDKYVFREKDLPRIVPGTLRDSGLDRVQTWMATQPGEGLALMWGRALPFFSTYGVLVPSAFAPGSRGLQPPNSKDQHTDDGQHVILGGLYDLDVSSGHVEVDGQRLPTVVMRYDQAAGVVLVLTEAPISKIAFDAGGRPEQNATARFRFVPGRG
jgi:hypothetical protein